MPWLAPSPALTVELVAPEVSHASSQRRFHPCRIRGIPTSELTTIDVMGGTPLESAPVRESGLSRLGRPESTLAMRPLQPMTPIATLKADTRDCAPASSSLSLVEPHQSALPARLLDDDCSWISGSPSTNKLLLREVHAFSRSGPYVTVLATTFKVKSGGISNKSNNATSFDPKLERTSSDKRRNEISGIDITYAYESEHLSTPCRLTATSIVVSHRPANSINVRPI